MPRFKVRCYEMGIWDEVDPREVEAQSEKEAVEIICGENLIESDSKLGQLRAKVWSASSPKEVKRFYVPAQQINSTR